MQSEQLFEAAPGVSPPWYVVETRFDQTGRTLTIRVDFHSGSRFSHPDAVGEHPMHDTQTKRYLPAAGRPHVPDNTGKTCAKSSTANSAM